MRRLLPGGVLLLFFIVSCAPKAPTPTSVQRTPERDKAEEVVALSTSWVPENIHLSCATGDCPPQVGLLIFARPTEENRVNLKRCTASLIGADRILTSGHCDGLPAQGYFVMNTASGRQVRKITGLIYKNYSPGTGGTERHAPDVAVFQLDRPVEGVEPLRLASGQAVPYSSLTGYVINAEDESLLRFRIDRIECRVHRHEVSFPFDVEESPDLITAFDCVAEKGNSGAPLFAPGHPTEVQAIEQAIGLGAADAASEDKDKPAYERHPLILATNARCLDVAGSHRPETCARVDRDAIESRVLSAEQDAQERLRSRPVPDSAAAKVFKFEAVPFELRGNGATEQRFEVFYRPVCRLTREAPAEIVFPSESVSVTLDEWARPHFRGTDVRLSRGRITAVHDDRIYTVEVEWGAPFGALTHEEEHPRHKWGARFSIDIPACAR